MNPRSPFQSKDLIDVVKRRGLGSHACCYCSYSICLLLLLAVIILTKTRGKMTVHGGGRQAPTSNGGTAPIPAGTLSAFACAPVHDFV